MEQIYASESPLQVLLITGLIGGGAAWLAGRAIAHTWRPFWHVIGYMMRGALRALRPVRCDLDLPPLLRG